MNCDCIKNNEARLAKFMQPKAGDDAKAECMATGLQLTKELNLRLVLNIPFRIKGSKKGFTSEKGKEMPFVASYCPFCGRTAGRYEIGEDAGIAAAFTSAQVAR